MHLSGRGPLLAHTLSVQAVTFVLRPAATYQALRLDVSGAWIGALGAGFALVPLLVAVRVGRTVDRFGERLVMIGGAAIVLVAALAFVLVSGSLFGLCCAVLLLGTGHLLATVGQHSAVANSSAEGAMDRDFGRYTFVVSLGQAVGPGLILLSDGSAAVPDTRPIFIVGVVGAVLGLAVTFWTTNGPTRSRERRDQRRADGPWRPLRIPGVRAALLVSTVVVAAIDVLVIYLPVVAADRGVSADTVGLLLAGRAAAAMLTRLCLGPLTRVASRRALLVASLGAIGAGLLLLALPLPTLWVVGVAAVGFGTGASQPLTLAWVAVATADGFRGRMMSLRLTGNRLGQVLIPASGGLLVAAAGPPAVFCATALLVLALGPAARAAPP